MNAVTEMRHEVEVDTRIAAAYGVYVDAKDEHERQQHYMMEYVPKANRIRTSFGVTDWFIQIDGERIEATPENILGCFTNGTLVADRNWGGSVLRSVTERAEKVTEAHNVATAADAAYVLVSAEYGGWTRFFLVRNNGGHIHSSMNCSTCNNGEYATSFGWLTQLSGLNETDAVAQEGAILCTVCYPSAPVEWTNGESRETTEKREAREAAKAAKAALVCKGSGETVDRIVETWNMTDGPREVTTDDGRCPVCNAKKWLDGRDGPTGRVPQHNTPKARKTKAAS